MRRSSRIPKELSILLTGSDLEGRGFSEMTKTVLLSRHGAGIVSTYKLYAEQEVIIRYLDTNREAVVRVVGRIGSEGENFTYGVAFLDPNLIDFWDIDFAPVSQQEKEARRVQLECNVCSLRETVEHIDVESDVLLINEGIQRYCKQCHDSTLWKRSAQPQEEEPALVAVGRSSTGSNFAGATSAIGDASADTQNPTTASRIVSAATAPPPSSTAASVEGSPSSASAPSNGASANPATQTLAPPVIPPVKHENRRKHSRTRVTYKACIRRAGFTDDVVTCEDMSRGGICFKSRKRYFEKTEIEVAVPYAPGGNTIFVPARIAWVVEVTPDKLYRCGVSYHLTARG
jgi:hypothetical protein